MTDQEINITIAELMGIPMEGSWCEHWGKIASCSAKQQAIAFLRVKGIKI